MGLGGGRSRLRVVKRSKDDTSICTLDTKMLFQRKEQGSDVKGPPVFGEIHIRIQTELPRHTPHAACSQISKSSFEMNLSRGHLRVGGPAPRVWVLAAGDAAPPQPADPCPCSAK
jgi:hypothetical protein